MIVVVKGACKKKNNSVRTSFRFVSCNPPQPAHTCNGNVNLTRGFDRKFAAKPKEWSVGETMEWLGQQGLARYATIFVENNIDGEVLLQLSNDDLRDELKIQSFGDRKKLEILIQQLKDR